MFSEGSGHEAYAFVMLNFLILGDWGRKGTPLSLLWLTGWHALQSSSRAALSSPPEIIFMTA
jgi:hypothetical protein